MTQGQRELDSGRATWSWLSVGKVSWDLAEQTCLRPWGARPFPCWRTGFPKGSHQATPHLEFSPPPTHTHKIIYSKPRNKLLKISKPLLLLGFFPPLPLTPTPEHFISRPPSGKFRIKGDQCFGRIFMRLSLELLPESLPGPDLIKMAVGSAT